MHIAICRRIIGCEGALPISFRNGRVLVIVALCLMRIVVDVLLGVGVFALMCVCVRVCLCVFAWKCTGMCAARFSCRAWI